MTKERLAEIANIKESMKVITKDREFKNLSSSEKDKLLETIAKMLGLIE